MRDQSGSGWKSGIATFVVALVTVGVAWWFTRREAGTVPVWSSDLERAAPGQRAASRPGASPGDAAVNTTPAADDSAPQASAPGPSGDDSAVPLPDGSPPPGFPIKGNPNSGLYHAPESPYYRRTRAQVCFRTTQAAEAAGFRHWNSRRRGK
jgi:hypothetical protein